MTPATGPCPCSDAGMTLRDYFAAKAMQGLLSNGNVAQEYIRESLVSDSYALADKMLEARK